MRCKYDTYTPLNVNIYTLLSVTKTFDYFFTISFFANYLVRLDKYAPYCAKISLKNFKDDLDAQIFYFDYILSNTFMATYHLKFW